MDRRYNTTPGSTCRCGQPKAMGHLFGEDMRCIKCDTPWEEHQARPQECPCTFTMIHGTMSKLQRVVAFHEMKRAGMPTREAEQRAHIKCNVANELHDEAYLKVFGEDRTPRECA